MKIKEITPKCEVCGKFLSYSDFNDDKIKITFIPDSPFSEETTLFEHRDCLINNFKENYTGKQSNSDYETGYKPKEQ